MKKLDYTLKTSEKRVACVREILKESKPTPQYMKIMTDYILFVTDKEQTKKERKKSYSIKTKNREVTVDKRQVSYEAVVDSLEDGEDGMFAIINTDGNQLLDVKERITEDDMRDIPVLQEQLNIIKSLKEQLKNAEGRAKYSLKKQIIETYQQMYAIKTSYHGWPAKSRVSAQLKLMAHMRLDEKVTLDDDMLPVSDGIISFFNPTHVSFLLTYYQALKQESYDDIEGDMKWFLLDFENLIDKALKYEPELYDILIWKVDGYKNSEIAAKFEKEYGISHTEQYFSTLWRNKIPVLIVEQARKSYLIWYYRKHKLQMRKCGKCGRMLPAHDIFFTHNNKNSLQYYSVCRDCRKRTYRNKIA